MKHEIIVSKKWVPILENQVVKGTRIKITFESGGGFGDIVKLSPSGKQVIIKMGGSAKSFNMSEILIREDTQIHLLKELMVGADPMMPSMDQNQNNPEINRINQYRARIARDQLELSRLVASYTKKQASISARPKPIQRAGTTSPQQAQAMQQHSARNAAAQTFPTMQAVNSNQR